VPRGHGSIPFDHEGAPCADSRHHWHWSGSFVVAVAGFLEEPPGSQEHEDLRDRVHAGRRRFPPGGCQEPLHAGDPTVGDAFSVCEAMDELDPAQPVQARQVTTTARSAAMRCRGAPCSGRGFDQYRRKSHSAGTPARTA